MPEHVRKTFTEPFMLRWAPEQKTRVEKAARQRGKKVSDFIRDAVMSSVEETEAGVREAKRQEQQDLERAFVPRSPGRPRGLGLRPKPDPTPPPAPQPPTSTVIVQIPGAAAPPPEPDEIGRLALHVLSAIDDKERKKRTQEIEAHIRSAPNRVEAEKLARALDLRIQQEREKLNAKKPSSAWSLLGR